MAFALALDLTFILDFTLGPSFALVTSTLTPQRQQRQQHRQRKHQQWRRRWLGARQPVERRANTISGETADGSQHRNAPVAGGGAAPIRQNNDATVTKRAPPELVQHHRLHCCVCVCVCRRGRIVHHWSGVQCPPSGHSLFGGPTDHSEATSAMRALFAALFVQL